ncbi:lanthionine synthetase LanC family protein [Wenjunlia tyrosinilytica]|nr:lanthionine synthetase LanC family protein [Wenjunlia tyrosinilytica]
MVDRRGGDNDHDCNPNRGELAGAGSCCHLPQEHPRPARPSWCYGTPGIARAGQLAALATGNTAWQLAFEDAFARCLTDPVQLARITDPGLCHGWAGLFQTAWRAARDAATPAIAAHLPHLAATLARHARPGACAGDGFLEGDVGTALALITTAYGTTPNSGWDSCLLID